MEFATLYKQNCAGCHGENGKSGVAVALANPVYLAVAGEATVRQITAKGVAGKLMPGFDTAAGGALTDQQIDSLVQGMLQAWGRPDALARRACAAVCRKRKGESSARTASLCRVLRTLPRSRRRGRKGANGRRSDAVPGSIVDPSYLALVSDQSLRSTIIAGRPDQGMPDWRSDISGPGSRAMTDQEITDIVAWLAAQRTAYPGQPYASTQYTPKRSHL